MTPSPEITLRVARRILDAVRAAGREQQMLPLSVVVLDAGGHLIAFEREDGSSPMRFQVAHAKAHGAVALGVGSRALMDRAEQQPYFITGATAAVGSLLAVPGGVLARSTSGRVVGAVGVSGDTSDRDEHAAVTGIASVGLEPVTG